MSEKNSEKNSAASIAYRLKLFRENYRGGLTQSAFAELIHMDQQRLSGYEKGARIPHHVIAELIGLGMRVEWLLFGKGTMLREKDEAAAIRMMDVRVAGAQVEWCGNNVSDQFYVLPLYCDEAAAGEPLDMRDTEIEGPAILHRDWCPHPAMTDYVRVSSSGTSMEPTIPAGSIVTIDRSQTEPDKLVGCIVAIGLREGGVTIKRLRRSERDGYVGEPDNQSGEHRPIPLEEGDRIIGRVQTVHAWIA